MRLREFAPSPERDDNDDIPDQLVVLANRWWNATDQQPQIEHVLNSLGWSIHQVESEDDAVQLQHRDGTTYFISADDFDPDLFEISDDLRRSYLSRAGKHVDRRLDYMARVRDRLNKGYEIYHAEDPLRIVHTFDADTPQEARRYYQDYNDRYESDRDYDLRFRRATGIMEDKTLDPELYGEELPLATVKKIVTGVVKQVDSNAKVTVKQSPEGYYIVRSEGLRLDFGITADGGDINANIVNAYSSYKGKNVVTEIFGQCFRAAEQLWGKPTKFVMSAHEDRGHGVWQHMAQKLGAKWEGSISEIARIPQGDFGDADTITAPKYAVKKKELPGGSGFTYAVGKPNAEDLEIMIFDGDTLAAELDLFYTRDETNAWRVSTVAVDPKYRSRGLGKALYGIALSILRLTLEAGDTQTKHGQRMWLMLNSIPGVEVMGYNMERTEKYKPRPDDKIISQGKDWTRYTFPVRPGTHSMRSGRHGTGMYTSQASMIAKWTGQ
jgi:GNAT superfamily N-acetyltransferase